jgi:hypothetical protein
MAASRNPSSATFPADPARNPDACFGSTRRSPGFGRLLSDVLTETVTLLCVSPLRGTGPHRVRRISRASGTPEVVCAVGIEAEVPCPVGRAAHPSVGEGITLYDGPAREVSGLEAGFSIVLVAALERSGAVTMDPTTGLVRRFRVSVVNSRGNRLVGSILGGQPLETNS